MANKGTAQEKALQNSIKPSIEELERFYRFINKRFNLNLKDEIVITIQTKGRRKKTMGWFWADRWTNGKGQVHEINISAEELINGNPYETLTHELVHYKKNQDGIKDCSKNQYHNTKFKGLAEKLLLDVSKSSNYGWGYTKPTPEWEKMFNSEFKPNKKAFVMFRNEEGNNKGKQPTKMKKWECGCGMIVRCAKELNAVCMECGTPFKREE